MDTALGDLEVPGFVADYLAKIGAAKLAGEKRPKTNPPELFDVELMKLGSDKFAEVRAKSDARSFRGYLLRALYYFTIDQMRKGSRESSIEASAMAAIAPPQPDESDEVDLVLDQFVTLFRRAIESCRNSPRNTNVHWDIFDAYIVRPSIRPDLQAVVSSRCRNEFLRHYFGVTAKQPESGQQSDAIFASYLSCFLGDSEQNDAAHADDELRREWLRIFSQPIYGLLCQLGVPEARQFKECIEYEGHPLYNLEQCWRHPAPPKDLLVWIKDAAKTDAEQPSDQRRLARPVSMGSTPPLSPPRMSN